MLAIKIANSVPEIATTRKALSWSFSQLHFVREKHHITSSL